MVLCNCSVWKEFKYDNTVKEKYYTEYDKKDVIWKTFLTVKTQICFVYAKESEGMTWLWGKNSGER